MKELWLVAAWLAALPVVAGCSSPPAAHNQQEGGGDGDAQGNSDTDPGDHDAGDGDAAPGTGELGSCSVFLTGECAAGLACVDLGATGRCLRSCTLPGGPECASDRVCVAQPQAPSDGFCAVRAADFAPCGGADACATHALCLSRALNAPARCVPLCDVGTLAGFTSVSACPSLPATLGGGVTECTPLALGPGQSASLCVHHVAPGAPCDEAALHCGDPDSRPDTDLAHEAATTFAPDPGALRCLPFAGTTRCARVCSTDDGTTVSPCDCASGDPNCADPGDPGLGWSCERWALLAAGVRACVALEGCVDSTACADNTVSGLSVCAASPYSSGPQNVCAAP